MLRKHTLHRLLIAVLLTCLFTACGDGSAPPVDDRSAAQNQAFMKARWEQFCDELKAMGSAVIEEDTGRAIDTAEGFRYLATLVAMGIENSFSFADSDYAQLARPLDTFKKIGLDSSDNIYRTAKLSASGVYRLSGYRGASTYLGFQINADVAAIANLNDKDLKFGEDGYFELYLSAEKPTGAVNWVQLPENTTGMYVREIFIDWDKEKSARLWLERLDINSPPQPLTPDQTAQALEDTAAFMTKQFERFKKYVSRLRLISTNLLTEPRVTKEGTPDNVYSGGYFNLAPDDALIIEFENVPSLFWSAQLGNNWFQSLDYQYRQTSLNAKQAQQDSDGKYRLVVAHRDPGVPNWLDTAGHLEGIMFLRWNQPQHLPASPIVNKIPFAELTRVLPNDTLRLSSQQRLTQLVQRRANVARRFGL